MVTHEDPIARFVAAQEVARKTEPLDATAMTLATCDPQGRPSARVVLLKGVDASGFTFFTNWESRKAREIGSNPWAALCFHWPSVEQQIRVEGGVTRLSESESDAYFATRPR